MKNILPKHALFYWLAATVLYFLPGLFLGLEFLLGSKDALFYTIVLKLYGGAMADGEFYPRWLADANAGLGSPVMIFYSPLSYLITGLVFGWLAPFDPLGHDRFLYSMALAQVSAGFTSFIWLRVRFGDRLALAGSLLYILLPYKFLYIWLHHNMAQLWALVWLPLWMLAAERLAQGNKHAVIGYGVCLALVAYTHLLSLIAFIALPALYVLFLSTMPWSRRMVMLVAAHVVGFMLCAVYFLPILFNTQFVWSSSFVKDFYQATLHLKHPDTYLCLYYLITAGLVAGLISRLPAKPKDAGIFWFFAIVTIIWWLMTTPLALPAYRLLPFLETLQFPMARLHSVLLIAGVWIALYGYTLWRGARGVAKFYSPWTALAAVLVCAFFIIWPQAERQSEKRLYIYTGTALQEVHRLNGIPPLEYITIWSSPRQLTNALLGGMEKRPLAAITDGAGDTVTRQEGNRRLSLEAHVTSPQATIQFRQWYFPGWRAYDENGTAYQPEVNEENGHMQLQLPQGDYRLTVSLPWVLGEKAGFSLTLLMLAAIALYWPLKSKLR